MIPSFPVPSGPSQQRLLKLFNRLDNDRQKQLLDFAEFLSQKSVQSTQADQPEASQAPIEPEKIDRPEVETVVAAIKRLSKTYKMLNKDDMLHQTSDLMSEHILKGRPAPEVIDDLESLFLQHYEVHIQTGSTQDES